MMKVNKWTLGLAAVGLVTLPATMQAEEKLSALQTALSSTTIGGYVDTSAHWAIGRGTTPPAYAFNGASKQDGFNLNVVNLVIEKPLDAQDNWAAGYKIDIIAGPNAVGWNASIGGGGDFGLKQAYVALRAPVGNGIDFKIGTFDTILGYEVFHAGNNPNYTRSWAFSGEPRQHTGLLATYQFCKEFGVAAGVANTYNAGINARSFLAQPLKSETDKTYMGAITLTAPDDWGWLAGSTLYAAVVKGWNTAILGAALQDSMANYYVGLTLNTPVKGLKAGVSYDHIANMESPVRVGVPDDYSFNAVSLYLSYQATEKLSFHGRTEYVWSNVPLGGASSGFTSDMLAFTLTTQYDLWANVLSRLEFRWDHSLTGVRAFNSADRNAFLLAANIIYKF